MSRDMPPVVYVDEYGQHRDMETNRPVRILTHVARPRWKTILGRILVGVSAAAVLVAVFIGPLLGFLVMAAMAFFAGAALLGSSEYRDTPPPAPRDPSGRLR